LLSLLVLGCASFHPSTPAGAPKSDSYVELDGVRVRYVDRGTGPAVVFVHGFASSLDNWRKVMASLAPQHRVIALDLKGFGFSGRPEGDYSPSAQARLVLALMDHLKIDRAAIVAHSWGASVALALTLAAPARVSRLALYDAWVYEEQLPTTFLWARADGLGEMLFGMFYTERADEKVAHAFFDDRFVTQELVDDVEAQLERPGTTAAALAAVRGQDYAQIQTRYPKVTQPVLLLWGREDRVTPIAYGERLHNELPNATLKIYPRCGHFPMIEALAPSTRDLRAFLAEPHARAPSVAPDDAPDDAPAVPIERELSPEIPAVTPHQPLQEPPPAPSPSAKPDAPARTPYDRQTPYDAE
jgi:pimeloyl-ACP methyl ester carboxylesterase